MSDWTREYEPDAENVVSGLDGAQRLEAEAIAQRIADAVGVRRIGKPFDQVPRDDDWRGVFRPYQMRGAAQAAHPLPGSARASGACRQPHGAAARFWTSPGAREALTSPLMYCIALSAQRASSARW
ncbi:hypothetical protein [Streptomyces parvus]|uniref:hypothetical protein n=1 Tax=Streptomyces parvus TaxID=66428 RepID=UPI002101A9D4|nr:hypothetical protein [Streptomyces parvus]MCQ1581522.1 hypothetical protein [Streptomyces parvus]